MMDKKEWVYANLQDEQSKFIFTEKVKFNDSRDYKYIESIIDRYVPEFVNQKYYAGKELELVNAIKKRGKKTVIWGAGYWGEDALKLCKYNDCEIAYICDSSLDKVGTQIDNIDIIEPKKLYDEYKIYEYSIIVSPRYAYDDIEKMLKENGIAKESIYKYVDYVPLALKYQYFDDDLITFGKEEVFIDGGCCDFSTSQFLIEKINANGGILKKIYAFEPDKENYLKCLKKIEKLKISDVDMVNAGLWNEDTQLKFDAQGNGSSCVVQDGNNCEIVEVVSLDSYVSEKVTFIKMDIEGSELAALRGARDIIVRDRPKLAICIYHKKEDMWEIPYYIKTLVPDYKLYIRHYSNYECETILYAV